MKSDDRELEQLDSVIGNTLRRVAELPDRSSPDDWPDAMLVTAEELDAILRDELLAAIPRWRPIETAPRDGTEILGYCSNIKSFGLLSCFKPGMWATNDGGYQRTPTHWMPLPAAPKEGSNG